MKNNLAKSSGSDIGDLENLEEGHGKILADNEATLIATLANLGRLSVRGSVDAAKMIADLGLKCASLLSEGLESPQSPSHKEAVLEAARCAEEWPISCPAIFDRRARAIENQIPTMLGEC